MSELVIDGVVYRPYSDLYAVSRCGKIIRGTKPYTPQQRPDGYLAVRQILVHRMVAICWVPKTDERAKIVHHKNHNKSDNRAENLEWVTPKKHMGEYHREGLGQYERTPQTREKIRQARLGKVTSEETKAKQRAALLGRKRPFFNRAPHTEEWKQNASLNHHKNTACEIFGVIYRSFAEASKATGIHRFTLRKRCLSHNFPEYKLVHDNNC